MEKASFTQHISQQFNEELEDIRRQVMEMGGLIEQQISNAVDALMDRNVELGEHVITEDYKINSMEVKIDEDCSQILARRQPAAGDLRLVMAVIKTITDLERIGDEAEKIGRMAGRLAEAEPLNVHYQGLRGLGEHAKTMVRDALDAFARMDVDAAFEVACRDANIDREYESIMRQMMTFMMEDPRTIRPVLDIMWSARALERIGDHARNICEYVIYLVKGKDVRHTSLEQLKDEIK